jgi:hypothetical protein
MAQPLGGVVTDIARLAQRVQDRLDDVYTWLDDHTADGYPATTIGVGSYASEPGRSPTLNALTNGRTLDIPILELEGLQTVDLRTVRIMLARALDQAEHNLRWAQQICDAIPRTAQGEHARKIDYELKHSRCEGWAHKHAICDDLDVKGTVVDGSYIRLCKACYDAMWRATQDAGERGRITRAAS